jgi:hypothetical protein
MTLHAPRRGRLGLAAAALVTGTLVAGLTQLPAVGGPAAPTEPDTPRLLTLGDSPAGLSDLDTRGTALPTAVQKQAASQLAATVRWNDFGTPASILPAGGSLGPATSSDAATSARAWLRDHRDLLGLTAGQVDGLELVNAQKLAQSSARAVLFRQRFGDLSPAIGSMVTVGVADGQVAYVSSSLTRTTGTPVSPELGPVAAWLKAAANVGRDGVDVGTLVSTTKSGWTRLTVPGFAQEQQVRLRALALADGSVRPVFEANVVDVQKGAAFAYTLMVDAVTGEILVRENKVDHSSDLAPFQGEVTADACGPQHPFELTDGETRQIAVAATAVNAANDIVVKLFGPGGALLASGDLGTSPETLTYAPGGTIPKGVYHAQVCPFDDPTVPFLPPGTYAGAVTSSDSSAETPSMPFPRWRYFPSNPALDWSADHTPKNTVVGCWVAGAGCTAKHPLANPYSSPWDYSHTTGLPTFTTLGNNASDREAWLSPLTPGGLAQAPFSPTREYTAAFTDAWNNSRCNPSQLVPGGNDVDFSATNLFVAHNRMHDYSYGLGFTERNYNLQQDNLGRNPDPTRQNDPEVGNVQAGALSGGTPSYLGRDNANQIALQDGIPGITNQYLFQPIAGAFYSPCADGSLDMSIVGHEYTHAISNRMIGGPDEGISSEQGGAMGESWGDLVAAEYLFSHGYSTGANPWAVGPYATGNRSVGIRDYAINANPLNYSNYGFDSTGDEVHADGEIWNGTMWSVRQALVDRYDARFPYADRQLQEACAESLGARRTPRAPRVCPGNRRWVQLMFDSLLLQQGSTSMLDARDAMLAADRMRFGGRDLKAMWDAFAKRGMGKGASTPNADSGDTKPSFASPRSRNARVTLATSGRLYVGRYEARSTSVADTLSSTRKGPSFSLVPGRHQLLHVSSGRGFTRFTVTVKPGEHRTLRLPGARNLAAKANGAKVLTASGGSLNSGSLIDGTESTNWAGVNDGTNVDTAGQHPFVAVDLAGGTHTVRRVQVSAMLRPAPAEATDLPLAADPDSGSRFTALRRFALEACTSACGTKDATWRRFYTSPTDAFPAVRPRPVAPNLLLRSFDVPDTRAAAIRLVALENQCTGYSGYAGEQDEDPTNATDCKTASDRGQSVRAAELQVF